MKTVEAKLTAQDIMTREPVCAEPSMPVRRLAQLLEKNEVSGVPVVDAEGRMIGVVSKSDLIRRCTEGVRDYSPAFLFEVIWEQGDELIEEPIPETVLCVRDFMTLDPVTMPPNTPIKHLARLMHELRIHRIVIVDQEDFPIGIVTSLDLLGAVHGGHRQATG